MSYPKHTVIDDVMNLLTDEDRGRIAPLKAAVEAGRSALSQIERRRDLAGNRAADFEREAERLKAEKRTAADIPAVDALLSADVSTALTYNADEIADIRLHNEDIAVRQSRASNIAEALRSEEEECSAQVKAQRRQLTHAERLYYSALANIATDLHNRAIWQVMLPLLSYFSSLRTALSQGLEGGAGLLDLAVNASTITTWENNSFTQAWPPRGNGHDAFLQRKGVSVTAPQDALDALVGSLVGATPAA